MTELSALIDGTFFGYCLLSVFFDKVAKVHSTCSLVESFARVANLDIHFKQLVSLFIVHY